MKTVLHKMSMADAIKAGYSGPIFVPVLDDVENVPYGEIMAELRKNRNPGNHKRYFAFIKMSFDMQDYYNEVDIWRKMLQMKAGFFDEVISEKGVAVYLPRSVNWDELDETEFKPLFTKIVNAFIHYYGQGLNDIQINSILEF